MRANSARQLRLGGIWADRALQYALLCRIHRPIGTYLLLWPPLWALWIAGEGQPDLWVLMVFIVGTFLMRSAGCAINDYADRNFDPHVARTLDRPVAAGRIAPREAVGVFVVLSLSAFGLVLTLNTLTILLSVVGALLAVSYPFAKRYTYLPQVHLGAAFGWAVPMAFAAQSGEVPNVGWLLFLATVLWATVYDTMYAMVDRQDDLKIGVKSTAILFGEADRVIIGVLQGTMLLALILAGESANLGTIYYLSLAIAAGIGIYHQWLIRNRQVEACFRAFLHNNWVGAAIFCGVVADQLVPLL